MLHVGCWVLTARCVRGRRAPRARRSGGGDGGGGGGGGGCSLLTKAQVILESRPESRPVLGQTKVGCGV